MAGVTLVPLGVELMEVEEADKAVARAGLGVHPSHVSCSTEQPSAAGCEAKPSAVETSHESKSSSPPMKAEFTRTCNLSNEIRSRVAA